MKKKQLKRGSALPELATLPADPCHGVVIFQSLHQDFRRPAIPAWERQWGNAKRLELGKLISLVGLTFVDSNRGCNQTDNAAARGM